MRSKLLLPVALLALALALVVGGLTWWGARPERAALAPTDPNAPPVSGAPAFEGTKNRTVPGSKHVPVPPEAFAQAWEEALANATTNHLPKEDRIARYVTLLRSIPHADYLQVVAPLMTRPGTDGAAFQAFWSDLQARPPDPRFPVLAELALAPDGPLAPAAAEVLKAALGADLPVEAAKVREAARALATKR